MAEFGLALVLGFGADLAALFLFALLADDVMYQETAQLDSAVLAWLRQLSSPTLDAAARAISLLGSEMVLVFLVVLLGLLARQRRWGAAVALLLVTGGAQLLNDLLKELFHRARPTLVAGLISAQQFSFPSGHAMVSAAFYGFVAYLGWRLVPGRVWRALLVAGLALVVLLIGLARMYLAAHFLSDVVAGYVAGLVWTDAVIIGGHLLARRARGVSSERGLAQV